MPGIELHWINATTHGPAKDDFQHANQHEIIVIREGCTKVISRSATYDYTPIINEFADTIYFASAQVVSRHHAKIVWSDGKPILYDMNSTHGTYVAERNAKLDVNGSWAAQAPQAELVRLEGSKRLVPGDFLQFGKVCERAQDIYYPVRIYVCAHDESRMRRSVQQISSHATIGISVGDADLSEAETEGVDDHDGVLSANSLSQHSGDIVIPSVESVIAVVRTIEQANSMSPQGAATSGEEEDDLGEVCGAATAAATHKVAERAFGRLDSDEDEGGRILSHTALMPDNLFAASLGASEALVVQIPFVEDSASTQQKSLATGSDEHGEEALLTRGCEAEIVAANSGFDHRDLSSSLSSSVSPVIPMPSRSRTRRIRRKLTLNRPVVRRPKRKSASLRTASRLLRKAAYTAGLVYIGFIGGSFFTLKAVIYSRTQFSTSSIGSGQALAGALR